MRYVLGNQFGAISPRILGTYEQELHPCIGEAATITFEQIVDIGASDGYYAVGLARSGMGQVITAFEANEDSQRLLRKVAALNGVDNIVVRGRCEIADLNAALCPAKKSLVICDVEGFEMELLDPTLVNGLLRAWVLVELHDCFHPGLSNVIRKRFESSHQIQEIQSVPREWRDFPGQHSLAAFLPHSVALRAMDEGRPPMS
jgi:hypothetical protein